MIDNEIIINAKNNLVVNIENNEEFKKIIREKLKFNTSLDLVSLKYLYKLLKFYKLEHYMSDLIDYGFYTAIQLNELNTFYYEKLNVSAYDLKKFSKLQAFIKQVMSTLKTTASSNKLVKTKQNQPSLDKNNNIKFSSSTSTLTSTPIATSSSCSSGNNIGVPIWENKNNNNNNNNNKKMVQQKSSLNKRSNFKQQPLLNTNSNVNNKLTIRSKSVEMKNIDDCDEVNKKAVPSVCHPEPVTYMSQKYKKSKSSYFGPQLKSSQIEHVEMKNYNYGVPNKQQQQNIDLNNNKKLNNQRSVSSSLGVKQRKVVANSENNMLTESNFEMADIYVFARKRPKLACEFKLNDAVLVEDPTIVINQAKCAVDGTEILRQV